MENLLQMGFPFAACENALNITSNNFEAALQMLIDQKQAEERNKRASAAEMRYGVKPAISKKPANGSTTTIARRTETSSKPTTSAVPPPAAQPPQMRTTNASLLFEDQSPAIDLLVYVLDTIVQNPGNAKYRSLNSSNPRFQQVFGVNKRLASQVSTYLLQLGFELQGEYFTLPPNADLIPLSRKLADLRTIQTTSPLYLACKQRLEFDTAIEQSVESNTREEDQRRREFRDKLPQEPDKGEAGLTRIVVYLSTGAPALSRPFHSDNTLRDVINYIGSQRSLIGTKLVNKQWVLMDETLLQKRALWDHDKTLHALGLWPSASLHVRLRDDSVVT